MTWPAGKLAVPHKNQPVLLKLNAENKTVKIRAFAPNETAVSLKALFEIERQRDPNVQAAIVSIDDLEKLRAAYPTYYLDTTFFAAPREATAQLICSNALLGQPSISRR
jgi:hypothetical protein